VRLRHVYLATDSPRPELFEAPLLLKPYPYPNPYPYPDPNPYPNPNPYPYPYPYPTPNPLFEAPLRAHGVHFVRYADAAPAAAPAEHLLLVDQLVCAHAAFFLVRIMVRVSSRVRVRVRVRVGVRVGVS
jgi:hypothetical protein